MLANNNNIINFKEWLVADLQKYLKNRGIVYSSYRKEQLVDLCNHAEKLNLPTDPNFFDDSISCEIEKKLTIKGQRILDPKILTGTSEISNLPVINQFDLYQYLVGSKAARSHGQVKNFKSLEGYDLYSSGYIEKLEVCFECGVPFVNVVKFKCKPRQRSEDPLNKVPYYNGWIILNASESSIHDAYCACKGGADGACRHTVAALFEVIEHTSKDDISVTCTSLPCEWKKKNRKDTSKPGPISLLKTSLPGNSPNEAPTSDYYDPCPEIEPDVDAFYEGLKVLKPDANMLMNRYILNDSIKKLKSVASFYQQLETMFNFFPNESLEDLIKYIVFSAEDIKMIEQCTLGQRTNSKWFDYRQGLITASNFYKVTHLRDSTNPDNLIKSLLSRVGNYSNNNLPPALKWGIEKEEEACKVFLKLHKASHKKVAFNETGLVIDSINPFLGATPDGFVDCQICGRFLIEIKCPWRYRMNIAEVAARANKCHIDDKGVWHLDPHSTYYSQIQGQLDMCKEKLCKLIIYTTQNIQVIDVPFDKEFCDNMRTTLVKFYMNYLGPATLKSFEKESV